MHISGELQAIVTAVMKGLRSFLWTVIFLLLLLYAVGVFITQSVTDFKISSLAKVGQKRDAVDIARCIAKHPGFPSIFRHIQL
jgi:sensor histidine kinase regulating citrate/malate metabolism